MNSGRTRAGISNPVSEESPIEILTFDLDRRVFGLPAGIVLEITRLPHAAALPKAPPIIEGVINLRGRLVPVLDLRQRFGLPSRAASLDQHLVVARAGNRVVALRVDRATDLVRVDDSAIEPPGTVAPGVEYTAGLARLPGGVLVIQDLDRFLALDEGRQVDHALADATAGAAAPTNEP